MVRSLGLVLAVVVVVFLIARPSASNSQRVRTVDYGPDVARARAVAPYQVLAPVGLGAGWRSTSSRVDAPAPGTPGPVALHIGFVTPRDAYAAVEESNAETDAFVADRTNGAAPRSSVVVGGRLWEQRQAAALLARWFSAAAAPPSWSPAPPRWWSSRSWRPRCAE